MANKKAPVKTTKKPTPKSKPTSKVPHLYRDRSPDCHKITGKFVWLYVLFALTTIVFAALAVYLFFMSSDLLQRLERINPDCREGNCVVVDRNHNGDDSEVEE
jgi:hypothetical protein